MAWFILGLLVYFLVLLSERTLAGISPHHLDQLHSTPSRLARLSQSIIAETPRVLSALLLARLLLQILTVTFTTVHLTRLNDVHAALFDISIWSGLPGQLTWCIAGLVYATLLVSVFWLLKKTKLATPRRGVHAAWSSMAQPVYPVLEIFIYAFSARSEN
jgi:Mg2+/Co2+ transporter CorB